MTTLHRLAAPLFAASALAGTSVAQSSIDFDIDAGATQFTYSGSTSLGPIVGNPSTFGLSGNVGVLLDGDAGAPPTSIALSGSGSALVSPDISATIPNPVPFFPPLASITITNLTLSLSSPIAPVDAAGNFTVQVTTVANSGTLTVTPLAGSPTVNDLTGSQSTPQPFTGSVSVVGTSTQVTGPLNINFQFVDSGSGLTADLDLNGTFVADYGAQAPTVFCTSNPNSTGATATLGSTGTTSLTAADLVLEASNVPANQFMLFILSDTQDFVPGFAMSEGNLCVGGSIIRLNGQLQNSGAAGSASLPVPYGAIPGGTLDIGETWYFQAWFRDVNNGAATSNTTDGLEVTFAP